MSDSIEITRDQLYEAIWSKPTTAVAKEFGISDVAIAKICKKLDIPKPKLGYWAKKQHGKRVRQIALPPVKPGTPETYTIHPSTGVSLPEKVQESISLHHAFETDEQNRIIVKDTLRNVHPLVRQTNDKLQSAYADQYNRLSLGSNRLDIWVGKDSARRALLIMDALIKALERRGYPVSLEGDHKTTTTVEVQDQQIAFGITEAVKRIERIQDDDREYSWGRNWDYIPTGTLALEIKERFHGQKVIRDGKTQRLEDCLNRFTLLLIKAAEIIKIEDVEREARWREYEKEREREQLAQRKRELEKVRSEQFFKSANDWQQCQMVRTYISAITSSENTASNQTEIKAWITWSTEKLETLESKLLNPELIELDSIRAQNYW